MWSCCDRGSVQTYRRPAFTELLLREPAVLPNGAAERLADPLTPECMAGPREVADAKGILRRTPELRAGERDGTEELREDVRALRETTDLGTLRVAGELNERDD